MPNVLWGYRDRKFFEQVPTTKLLETVGGLPESSHLHTFWFGLVSLAVKTRLKEILTWADSSNLIEILEREFEKAEVLQILHALYLGLYSHSKRPVIVSRSITQDITNHGVTLERIFAHHISLLTRFKAFKTPQKIDDGKTIGPWIDIVLRDDESSVIWWVVITARDGKPGGAHAAQKEVDRWTDSDVWYTQTTIGVENRHPVMYSPNKIMAIRFHNFDHSGGKWKQSLETWQRWGYIGNMYDTFDWPEWQFLGDFFWDFPSIMNMINLVINKDDATIEEPFWNWRIQMIRKQEWRKFVYNDPRDDSENARKIILYIPDAHPQIPRERTSEE